MAQTAYAPLMPAAALQTAGAIPKRVFWKEYPLADGLLDICDPVREEQLPFDPGRFLVLLAFILLAIGACGIAAVFGMAAFVLLLFLGGGLICLLPVLLPAIGALFSPVMFWLRGKRARSMVSMQIIDQALLAPVSVIIYLKEGSGAPHLGSKLRVFGALQRRSNTIRASRLEVYEANGQAVNYTIAGIMPWPWWAGAIFLLAVILLYAWILYNGGWIP